MSFHVEPLGEHRLDRFRCGNVELDSWLVAHAYNATGQGTRTYVLVDTAGDVVGYFAIAPHLLARDDAPRSLGRGAPSQIPAVLLAKLALDDSLHGRGLGAELLVFALTTIIEAARHAGGRVIVVDAIDENAARFYAHHDFQALPGHDQRLVLKLSTAAKALDITWP